MLRLRVRSGSGEWVLDASLPLGIGTPPRCTPPRRFCGGDFNGDQLVDDADFTTFAVSLQYCDGGPAGDVDGDTTTDDADFLVFSVNYDRMLFVTDWLMAAQS